MRILVYKRTHGGDPDANGCFGVYDCMGTIRDREYEAVIGVGGIGREAKANGIDGRVNWVGIGPHKRYVRGKRGPEVRFDHFLDFGSDGPDFRKLAPLLAERMYGSKVRSVLNGLSARELAEATAIVQLAEGEPPSAGMKAAASRRRSMSRCSATRLSRCSQRSSLQARKKSE
jgi:hypothetical protein